MKHQNIGVEIEATGITRAKAAEVVASFLGGTIERTYDSYDTYKITGQDNWVWKVMRDSSIITMKKQGSNLVPADDSYSVELVTPILNYDNDIETLQEIIRRLRKAGAVSSSKYLCSCHIHIDAKNHTASTIKNLVNIVASKEDLIYKSLQVDPVRMKYCKKINENFLQMLNKKKPKTMEQLADIWYEQYGWESRSKRYHSSRYSGLNLHSTFTKNTIEFRCGNGCLHSGRIRAWLILCLAISHQALTQKSASAKRTLTDNEKYTFRVWLNRMGLIGDEYKNCRLHLLKNLEGDSAWKVPRAA